MSVEFVFVKDDEMRVKVVLKWEDSAFEIKIKNLDWEQKRNKRMRRRRRKDEHEKEMRERKSRR